MSGNPNGRPTTRTIDFMKARREVSPELKNKLKELNEIKRAIEGALKERDKTIPEISAETGLPLHTVTYYVMTLCKKGRMEAGEIDEDDEYYDYRLTAK